MIPNMSGAQRAALAFGCLLFVYCCVWIPWHVSFHTLGIDHGGHICLGYGWVWSGPSNADLSVSRTATPDDGLIALRIGAVIGFSTASMLILGTIRSKQNQ